MGTYRNRVTNLLLHLFLLSFVFGGLTTTGYAAVFNVTTSAELQTALTTAQSNFQADIINIEAGTYDTSDNSGNAFTYTGASTENFALTLDGTGAMAGMTFLDGGNSTRVLFIDNSGVSPGTDADITITDLTIQNGHQSTVDGFGGGGLRVKNGSADTTVEDCRFSNNSVTPPLGAIASGGGARFDTTGAITLTSNAFDNNSATASPSITSSPAAFGGGAHVRASGAGTTLTNNTFVNNSVTSTSGALSASGGGARIESSSVILTNNTFDNNSAAASSGSARGGGAFVNGVGATLTNNTFVENFTDHPSGNGAGGGAFFLVGGATLTNNTFTLNSADGDGGGLRADTFNNSSTINIYNNIVWSNTATGDGNDIFVFDDLDGNHT